MRPIGRSWRALLLIATCAGAVRAADGPPAPLARYFQGRDLVAYVEFDGIDAHSEAWKKTAVSKILNETPTGAMLESVVTQIAGPIHIFAPEAVPSTNEMRAIVREVVRSGFAFAINRKADDPSAKPSCIGLVIRGGGKGSLVATLEEILKSAQLPEPTMLDKPGGRKVSTLGPVAWWVEKEDLVFALVDPGHVDAMIAALDGKAPNAVDHPLRKELAARDADGFEPAGLAFLDVKALPEMPPEAAIFGLDGIKRADIRWGYQGEALVSVSRIEAPAPRRGVLAMFDQPTFGVKSLPPLPRKVGEFTAISLDPLKVFDQLAAVIKAGDPQGPDLFAQAAEAFRATTGRRLREDFLARLGPRMVVADVPTQVFVTSNFGDGFAKALARVPRLSLLIEVRDREAFLKDLDAVANWANAQFPLPAGPSSKKDGPAPLLVRKLKNIEGGYEVALSPTFWPLPAGYRPSIVVGEKFVAFGTSPDVARQALRGEGELDAPLARTLAGLPSNLTALSVVDAPNSALPEFLANVPSLIQWWGFMIQGAGSGSPFVSVGGQGPRVRTVETIDPPVPPAGSVPGPDTAPTPSAVLPPPDAPPGPGQAIPPPQVAPTQTPPKAVEPQPVPPQEPGGNPVRPVPVPEPVQAAPAEIAVQGPSLPEILFRLRFDPDEIPTPDEIRPYLFPATYSLSVDEKGFRIATRESFPGWNPISAAPIAVAVALPIYQDWREEREKERLSVNLKRIGIALNAYQEKHDRYPSASTRDKDGKPLLSWRVELLPFLGLQSLYDEFHRDEPWDGPHNKALIEKMPKVFEHPDNPAGPGLTFYRGVGGAGAFFEPEPGDGVTVASITDGTSNTLAVVEAKEAVPWTKPGTEIPSDKGPMVPLLGSGKGGKFLALIVDGSVRLIRDSIDPTTLRSLTTRAGGEVLSADMF